MKITKLFTALMLGWVFLFASAGTRIAKADDIPFYAENPVVPNVLIILDRSGSMEWLPDNSANGDYCGDNPWGSGCANESKISIAVRVLADLLDDDDSLSVDNSDDPDGLGLRLGYYRFIGVPNSSTTGAGEGTVPQYDNGDARVIDDVGDPYPDIFNSFNSSDEGGWTPNGTSLSEALNYFLNDTVFTGDSAKACRRNFVIILTDGMDTVTCDAGTQSLQNRRSAVHAADDLRTADTENTDDPDPGVPVFVIGLGNMPADDQNVLNWIAYHGGTDNPLVTNAGSTSAVPVPGGLCTDGVDPEDNNLSGYAFIATDANELTTALKAAVAQIKQGAYTRSAPVIATSGARMYMGYFDLPYWKGHLQAFEVDENGNVNTASYEFDSGEQMFTNGRGTVYTAAVDGSCVPLADDIDAFSPSASVATSCADTLHGGIDIDGSGGAADDDDAREVIEFTLDPAYSNPTYVGVRDPGVPAWKLGDIYHSKPVVVGPPNQFYVFDYYATFRSDWEDRETLIYVNANDGMLHALQGGTPTYNFVTGEWDYPGETGDEKWAYVPNAILDKLKELRIDHDILVDATPAVADVYADFGSLCGVGGSPCWRTVLVSGLRDGGAEYFALDVTDPDSPKVLWEMGDAQMGNTWSRPSIGRIKCQGAGCVTSTDGERYRWVAFVGGGVPSSGTAKIYAIDIASGSIVASENIPDLTGAEDPQETTNGVVGAIRAVGKGYGLTDTVYFGDLEGKLWRLDVSNANTNQWEISVLYDPFAAGGLGEGNRRPIYNAASVALVTSVTGSNYYLAFGTGSESDSEEGPSVQNYFFLVMDPNMPGDASPVPVGDDELIWRTGINGVASMALGEKNIGDPVIFFGYVYFTTYVPNPDPCSIGTSYLWQVALTEEGGVFEDTRVLAGEGLPSGPVIIQSPEGGAKVVVATSAGGDTGSDLLSDDLPDMGGGQGSGSIPGPSSTALIEEWREIF